MQLILILGVAAAIGAVVFALQNNTLVVVTLAFWSFEQSLAIVLLLALALGVLITALLSTPAVVRAQWANKRLRRRVAELERRQGELTAELQRQAMPGSAPAAQDPAYVGLRSLLSGGETSPPPER